MIKKRRSIVLTPDKIYVFNKNDTQPRYAHDYSDILGVTVSLIIGAKNMILHLATQADEEWQCENRNELVEVLATNFELKTGKKVDIYGVSSTDLSVYLTTERDLRRKVSKIPGEFFKLESRSSMYKSATNQEADQDWDDYEELFDDFVMLEKGDVDRYNDPAKLKKAKNEKDSGPSQCLMGKPGINNEKVTLEDFVILKVIDKGSFGKVFLVSNKKMGKLYAMKRINKDVLIEKKQIKNIRNEKEILF